jgi:site-specific DNA recombinase
MGSQPAPPAPGTIDQLHTCLASGTPAERKAAIQALVGEVRITNDGLVPVFRIPRPRTATPGSDSTAIGLVRAMGQPVGRLGLEPRTHGLKVRCSTIELTPREN